MTLRHLVDDADTLLDWDVMTSRLAAAAPTWEPGTRPGYHGLTYGWLVGELIRRVTGGTVTPGLILYRLSEAPGLELAQVLGPLELRFEADAISSFDGSTWLLPAVSGY